MHMMLDLGVTYAKPPPNYTITQHAEANRILSPENCAIPGPYRVSVTPFIREILDTITDPAVEKVVCQKSAQVAWTDGVINNAVCYFIDQDPAPIMILFPTTSMGERYSKEKLATMIRDTPCLANAVADPKSRNSGNTILSKNFAGGHLELVGSNAPASLSSSPIRIVIVEEPDRCALNSGKEGDSLKLAFERTKTFHNRKLILGGSPTIKGISQIEREMALSDQRVFEIPCPFCNAYHVLQWKLVKWEKDADSNHPVFRQHRPETATIECPNCKKRYDNRQKNAQLSKGRWIPKAEFNGTAGFYINELYSPFPKATLQHVVEKFLEAKREMEKGNVHLLTTWTNTSLGEPFEIEGEKILEDEIKTERLRPGLAPEGVLFITAGVDVQKDRLEVEVVGFGDGEESWSLSYDVLYGDPERQDVWDQLDEYLQRDFVRLGCHHMKIACCCIDSGNWTQAVYRFVKPRQRKGVWAVKGVEGHGDPYVSTSRKKGLDKNVRLFIVSDQTATAHVYGKLRVSKPGPGYCHFPDNRPERYFQQLTGVQLVTKYKNGVPYKKYIPITPNQKLEALDCRKYAVAALIIRFKDNPPWKKLQRLADLAIEREQNGEKPMERAPKQKRKNGKTFSKQGYVNRWKR